MQAEEKAARKMFAEMGMPGIDELPSKKLATRLRNLPNLISELSEPQTEESKGLFSRVSKAIAEEEDVELIQEESTEAASTEVQVESPAQEETKTEGTNMNGNGEHKASPKTRKKTQSKIQKKTKPANGAKVDRFGSRVGSDNARLNAALGKRPKTVPELVAAAGIKPKAYRPDKKKPPELQLGGYYTHLKKLLEAGHVKKTEDGYVVK